MDRAKTRRSLRRSADVRARRHFDARRRRVDVRRTRRRQRTWQPTDTIAAAAREAAAAEGAGEVEAVAIDERLKLKRCAAPLDAKVERPITARPRHRRGELQRASAVAICSCRCAPSNDVHRARAHAQRAARRSADGGGRRRRATLVGIAAIRLLERWRSKPSASTMRRTQAAGAVITAGRARGARGRAPRRARHTDRAARGPISGEIRGHRPRSRRA